MSLDPSEDILIADFEARYNRYHRREARRAKIIHVTKWVFAAVLGIGVGAIMIGIAAFVGDIPLRGW